MQAKSQRGFSNKKPNTSSSRPSSSNPLNRNIKQNNNQNIIKNRPLTAKIPNQTQTQQEKVPFQLKINPLNSNNNFRPTRPASSATDRVFNRYWENKTPQAANLQTINKFDFQSPKGESLITNELLVDLNKKQKSIYNRSLYKYNKIDWESKKNSNFLSTVGGLEIKSDTCILNTPMQNYENFSINSTAIASRPQSNTAFGNSANNFFSNNNSNNAKGQIGFKQNRPLTGFPIKSKNNILRLHSAKIGNEDYDSNSYLNLNKNNQNGNFYERNNGEVENGFYDGNYNVNGIGSNLGVKRPLTGNVNKRANVLRPFSAASNKMTIEANDKERKVINLLSEELGEEPIDEIFNESLSLDLSSEKLVDSPSCINFKSGAKTKQKSQAESNKKSKQQKQQQQQISPSATTNNKNINFKNSFNTSNNLNNNNNNSTSEFQSGLKGRIKSACGYYPKVETLLKNFEKIDVKAYSIKLQVADADLLDLFDHSQRTKAATLAKVGDYEYYTPCQRIGSFMDFSATLRWKDLKNIEKHYVYTKNQLGFLQSKHNIITLVEKNFLKNSSEHFRDPNSLFHGFLRDEYLLDKYYKELSESESKKTYDPYEFLPKCFFAHLHDPRFWDEGFTKHVQTSLTNYNKYFNSDKITVKDLEPFNENVRNKILVKVEFLLFEKRKKIILQCLEEIKQNYYYTLKSVIMQYILRSPYERKRLNIQFYSKQTPPSSIIIANHGSFNRSLYKDWVKNYGNATENLERNLFAYDIISTSILEWTECFKHVNLVYLKLIRNLSYLGSGESKNNNNNHLNSNSFNANNNFNGHHLHGGSANFNIGSGFNNGVFSRTQTTMHLGHFKEIQASYAMKTFFFLRDVYYRGVVLILKKNKFFKTKADVGEGKWTFKGYVKKPAQASFNYAKKKSVNFNFNSNNTSYNHNNNINMLSEENNNNNNFSYNSNRLNSPNNNKNNTLNSRPTSPIIKSNNNFNSGSKTKNLNNNNLNFNNNNNINNNNKPNHNQIFKSEFFGMDIFEKIEDFWADFFIDDFPDIRMTHSYFLFLANSNKKNIDLSKYIYDQYDEASKLKLNNSITTFVTLFFRQLIEKSVEELVNFIVGFKLVDEIVTNMNQQFLSNNPNYNFDLHSNAKAHLAKDINVNVNNNFNNLNVIKQLKETNSEHGNGSNNSSNRNIINVNAAAALNINNINLSNFNNNASKNNFNLNINKINEVEKFEKSFKDADEYVTSSGNILGPMSPNNFNNNFNNINNNNKNLIPNLNNLVTPYSNLNSLNINININTNTVKESTFPEPLQSEKNKNTKQQQQTQQIHMREASRDITVKSSDTTHTKDFNQINLNNHQLFPHYDINAFISYKDHDIKLPLIKSFVVSDTLNPVMHISTKIDSIYNVVKLEYSYDQVSEIFIKTCDNIVGLFNGLYTTHFVDFKTVLPPEVERIQKAHMLRINEVFSDKLDTSYKDYFSNISPNLILDTEKFSDANYNSAADDLSDAYNYFSLNIKNNFLKPALLTEEIFVNYRNMIAKTVKDHMLEMEEVLRLFEPVKDLINHSFAELVNHFKENFGTIPEYNKFTFFVEKIRTYLRYVNTIPDFVYYSLFAVDTRESKAELIKRLNELMNTLMREMENLIIQIYHESIESYNKLHGLIDKKITTPDELVEMEALKANVVNMDVLNIGKNLDEANKIHFFLLSLDNIFSDNIIFKSEEMKRRFNKFKRDCEEIEKSHQKDREFLEEKFRQDRKKLEKDLQSFYDSINSLDSDIHINTYETIVQKIKNLETQIESFKLRIENNFKDEEKLFSFKLNTFEEFESLLAKLDKYSVFWQKAFAFYEIKKPVILCFSEELDFLSIINQFNEIEKVVAANRAKAKKDEDTLIKMSKILEDDLEITREFILLSYNILIVDNLDDNLRMKIIEMLDSKKLEQSCKLIIENVLKIRNYSLV